MKANETEFVVNTAPSLGDGLTNVIAGGAPEASGVMPPTNAIAATSSMGSSWSPLPIRVASPSRPGLRRESGGAAETSAALVAVQALPPVSHLKFKVKRAPI